MPNSTLPNITDIFLALFLALGLLFIIAALMVGLVYLMVIWYKNRDREKQSLDSTLLQIALPRDNEIKIDAAEQLFASLAGIKATGGFSFLKYPPHVSFEIVAMPEDIRFY